MNDSVFINEHSLESTAQWTDDHTSKASITTNGIPSFAAKSLVPMHFISAPVSSSTKQQVSSTLTNYQI